MAQLKAIEDVIIEEVTSDKDTKSVIEGGTLTEKLQQSRIMSKQIGKSLIEIKNAMTILMRTAKIYKPVSVRAAKFFYLISDLVKLNNMYQFTHEWFFSFFNQQLEKFPWRYYKSPKGKEKGLMRLRRVMTKNLF